MKTSYFSNPRIKDTHFPVRISWGNPRFKLKYEIGAIWESAKPTREGENQEEAKAAYLADLEAIPLKEEIAELEKMAEGQELVFLCFEKPPKFCHREWLAEFLRSRGYEISELEHEE